MTRAERYAEVKALRDRGLLLREIAERVGLAKSTVHDLLLDPTGEKARERKRRYEHPCVDCGKTVNPNGLQRRSGRCRDCAGAHERALSRRWIIASFQEWEELFGVPPAVTDWNTAQARAKGRVDKVERYESTGRPWPAVTLVQENFGSWNAGRAAAGFDTFEPGHYGRDGEDPALVAETIALYRTGLSAAAVGERMGCSGSAVLKRLELAGEPRREAFQDFNARKTHCPQGHPYDEENTYRPPSGGRRCKTCHRDAMREYMRRQRMAA